MKYDLFSIYLQRSSFHSSLIFLSLNLYRFNMMEDLNVSANLTDMLDKLSEEQSRMSGRVGEKEEEKAFWERKVGTKRSMLESVEMELNKIKKEGMIVEDELRMKVSLQKMRGYPLHSIVQGDTFFKDLLRYPLAREGVPSPGGCVGLAHATGRFSNIVDSMYALQQY